MSPAGHGSAAPFLRWAIPAAATWIFALGTLGALAMMIGSLWPPGSGESSHIFGTEIDGVTRTGFLIAYRGTPGLLLAGAQATAVAAGLLLSLRAAALPRRAGGAILVGWGCLWLGNAIYFTWTDAYFRAVWLAVTALIAAFLACTAAWAARRW